MIGNSNTDELEFQLNANKTVIKPKPIKEEPIPEQPISFDTIKSSFMGLFAKIDLKKEKKEIVTKRTKLLDQLATTKPAITFSQVQYVTILKLEEGPYSYDEWVTILQHSFSTKNS